MTNTKTENVADTVAQINALTDLGCDIIRCAAVSYTHLAKDIKKKGEEAKVAVRNIRRDAIDSIKKTGKEEGISCLLYTSLPM